MSVTERSRPSAVPSDESFREDASSMTLAERPRRRLYQYEPLRNPKSDIRVLKLRPSSEPGELHCSLETCSLDDKPFYVAVSYEWGEPEPLVDIRVNGKPFRIRHNLWLFLNHLQNNKMDLVRHDHFRLWADAICIDQTNLTEKGTQVQIMSRIFKDADSVFAWLGYTTRLNTQNVFRFIKEASFLGQSAFPRSDEEYSRWYQEFVPKEITSCHVYYGSLLEIWKEILQLSRLSYWSRRWIVQELLISREMTLLLDGKELTWSAITAIFQLLQRNIGQPTSGPVSEVLSELLQTIPWKLWSHKGLVGPVARHCNPFEPLLQSFRQTVCTVPYDKVYAFLGLIENGNSIEVDYGCSMIDVFCKVASFGGITMLSATLIGLLATELGLSGELEEKRTAEAIGVGPSIKYSVKLSNLARIVEVGSSSRSVVAWLEGHSNDEWIKSGTQYLQGRVSQIRKLGDDKMVFDTNLVYSCVEHKLGVDVCLGNSTDEISECEGGNIYGIPNLHDPHPLPISYNCTVIVCEDGNFGLSCCSTLPGDFICPMGRQKQLVLRYNEGVFTIVGKAALVLSDSELKMMKFRKRRAPGQIWEEDVEATFMTESHSASSIDILFNVWELLDHAQKWTPLEDLPAWL